jgi:hypothetical protein
MYNSCILRNKEFLMDYGMYSEQGNKLVDRVVAEARVQGWDWPKTARHLALLSKAHPKTAGEANDTVVREVVFNSLNYKTNFYY